MSSAPFEITLGPANTYYAPLGEDFPAIDDPLDVGSMPGNWLLLADALHITEAGITIVTDLAATFIRSLGSVVAVKAGIQTRDFKIEFEVMDNSAEALALASGIDPADNDVGVQTTPAGGGDAGYRSLELPTGPTPQGFAVLLRWNDSAYGDGFNSQYEIRSGVQVGAAGGMFSKTTPFGVKHQWVALNSGDGFVRLVEQDAVAS